MVPMQSSAKWGPQGPTWLCHKLLCRCCRNEMTSTRVGTAFPDEAIGIEILPVDGTPLQFVKHLGLRFLRFHGWQTKCQLVRDESWKHSISAP